MTPPDSAESSELHEVTLVICGPCLDGAGGECHTPGCSFWMSAAPDVPLRENQRYSDGTREDE